MEVRARVVPKADSVVASGSVSAPVSGTTLATIAAASLPAGVYRIQVWVAINGAASIDVGNAKLLSNGASVIPNVAFGISASAPVEIVKKLDGSTNDLTVKTNGASTAGTQYECIIVATLLEYAY